MEYGDLKKGQSYDAAHPTLDNYQYDEIGNLVKDQQEGIVHISWTVYGKVERVEKTDGTTISFAYDAAGNRISKREQGNGQDRITYYVRDASGNVMANYVKDNEGFKLTEQPIYGSDRIGQRKETLILVGTSSLNEIKRRTVGLKVFELKNHLGNVLATVSDRKDKDGNAVVVSASDYYPFGMTMPNVNNVTGYRYGFNGKEKDTEGLGGGGSTYDYGFRIYNPAIAKFLSTDPLSPDYPELTPYQFASNMPINSIDLDGLEQLVSITMEGQDIPVFYKVSDKDGRKAIEGQFWTAFRHDLDPSKYVWTKGEREYKRYGSLYAPLYGTLNVHVKSDKTYLSFDPTPHSRIERDFSIIDSYQVFRQTYRGQEFEETLSNVALAGSMIITGGASSSIRLSGGAAKFLESSFGKGIFDILGQAIVKGDLNKIDISDAAASAFVGNKHLKNLIKSFADLTIEGGFSEDNIKGINEGLAEFGLRIGVDAANSPIKGGASKYVIDIIKKEQREEIKSTFSGDN